MLCNEQKNFEVDFFTCHSYYVLMDVCMHSTNPVQSVERTFQLTRADKDLLVKQEYDVQVSLTTFNLMCKK